MAAVKPPPPRACNGFSGIGTAAVFHAGASQRLEHPVFPNKPLVAEPRAKWFGGLGTTNYLSSVVNGISLRGIACGSDRTPGQQPGSGTGVCRPKRELFVLLSLRL